jgi:hypothetical protein
MAFCYHIRDLTVMDGDRVMQVKSDFRSSQGKITRILPHSGIRRRFSRLLTLTAALMIALLFAGCGSSNSGITTPHTQSLPAATATTLAPAPAGIALNPDLKSASGTPAPNEMKALIALQQTVPYPVMVPTQLPSGMKLDPDTIGSGKTAGDPVGYYSYRYYDPANQRRTLTFNQTGSNSSSLAGYYVTSEHVNGVDYQVYWHRTRDYLQGSEAVRTTNIIKAETYIVVWKSQYKDAAGQPHDLYYSMSTGTWTGWDWDNVRAMLVGLKPLSAVGS